MTSKTRSQKAFLKPEMSRERSIKEERGSNSRKATVYDAVAGRISAAGFIPKEVIISSTRDTASSSNSAVSPEAVLFRGRNAPTRYAESDIYFAVDQESQTDLPESDLLKALHCYVSDFYSRATPDGGAGDWRSLDETALIALGILMEESSRKTLGETGDLVFTEGEEVDDASNNEDPGPCVRSQALSTTGVAEGNLKPSSGRQRKKRRLLEPSEEES